VKQGKREDWSVENGVLVCNPSQKGWLGTQKQYSDFILRLEWRVASKGGSGVYLRAPDQPGYPPENGASSIQIMDDSNFPGFPPKLRSGALFNVVAPARPVYKGTNAWNTFEITCRGDRIAVVFNGEKVVDASGAFFPELATRPRKGFLGLQSFDTVRVEFRNIVIRELDGKETPTAASPQYRPRWTVPNAIPKEETNTIVSLAPDGKALLSRKLGKDFKLRFWDPATGKLLFSEAEPRHSIAFGLEFAATGRRFVLMEDDPRWVSVWDAASHKELWRAPPGKIEASVAALSGDGSTMVLTNFSTGNLEVWDVDGRKLKAVLVGSQGSIKSTYRVSSDGRFVAAIAANVGKQPNSETTDSVVLWDVAKPDKPVQVDCGARVSLLQFAPDGHLLGIVGYSRLRWEVPTLKQVGVVVLDQPGGHFVFLPTGPLRVFRGDDPKTLLISDAITGQPKAELIGAPAKIATFSVTSDGHTVAAACEDGSLCLWQVGAAQWELGGKP
jgi:hypothetical protein